MVIFILNFENALKIQNEFLVLIILLTLHCSCQIDEGSIFEMRTGGPVFSNTGKFYATALLNPNEIPPLSPVLVFPNPKTPVSKTVIRSQNIKSQPQLLVPIDSDDIQNSKLNLA